jgi:hypothetical protein
MPPKEAARTNLGLANQINCKSVRVQETNEKLQRYIVKSEKNMPTIKPSIDRT